MRLLFWTCVRWIGGKIGDLGLWVYWIGKHGQQRCRGRK